jgi:hypothetical protein
LDEIGGRSARWTAMSSNGSKPGQPAAAAMSRATRSPNANATRDWRIYANFAERLIGIARGLYAEEPFGVDLAETVYALDATTIDLCLSVFPWACSATVMA